MAKSGTRTLPPLVYGKLSGVFEFAVDSIEITEKLFTNQDCNFVVQILWWGESKPLFVRPKRAQYLTENKKQVIIDQQSESSVKYEVRTKVKLFKSYLAKCDVMELVILDEVKNEVIGSSFLKDLIFLVYHTQLFTSSIINYSGCPIGTITCHFLFCEVSSSTETTVKKTFQTDKTCVLPIEKWNSNDLKININLSELQSPKEEIMSKFESNRSSKQNSIQNDLLSSCNERQLYMLDNYRSQRSSTVHYNSPVTQKSLQSDGSGALEKQDHSRNQTNPNSQSLVDSHSVQVDIKVTGGLDFPVNSKESHQYAERDGTCTIAKTCSNSKLPPQVQCAKNTKEKKIIVSSNKFKKTNMIKKNTAVVENVNKTRDHIVKHATKVASKRVPANKVKISKNKTISTDRTYKVVNRDKTGLGNAVSVKNIVNFPKPEKISNSVLKSIVKSNGNLKSFVNVSSEISKLNKLYLNPTDAPSDNHLDLEKVPVKENVRSITSDTAVDHLVHDESEKSNADTTNVNKPEVCENSASDKIPPDFQLSKEIHYDKDCKNDEKHIEDSKNEKVNVNNKLFFDLSDPIEKIYYETFFIKTETLGSNEFEIAELLNHPENKYIFDATPQGKEAYNEVGQHRSRYTVTGKTQTDDDTHIKSKSLAGRGDEVRRNYTPKEEDEPELDSLRGVSQRKDTSETRKIFDPLIECGVNSNEREECDAPEFGKRNEITNARDEYKSSDCHRCKYFKKLSELDKIIESLKEFETNLKKEVKQSTKTLKDGGGAGLPTVDDYRLEILSQSGSMERFTRDNGNNLHPGEDNSDQGDFGLGNIESDCSKESDFIEFTHYLSKR